MQQAFEVPVKVIFEAPDRIHAETTFSLGLDSFKIDRPSLMFVKVDDEMKIDAKLWFKKP